MGLIQDTTGLVLAGGLGARMGHVDKGLQVYRGMPLVDHVIARLQPQVSTLLISANRNLQTYGARGFAVIADEVPGYAGPLAGLHAALTHCRTPWLLCAPCDSPRLPLDLAERLHRAFEDSDTDLAVPVTGHGAARRVHAATCLVRTSALESLEKFLRTGERAVRAWHRTLSHKEVAFTNDAAFDNINTVHELQSSESAIFVET